MFFNPFQLIFHFYTPSKQDYLKVRGLLKRISSGLTCFILTSSILTKHWIYLSDDDNDLYLWNGRSNKVYYFLLFCTWNHYQRISPSEMPRKREKDLKSHQNLSLDSVEWSWTAFINITPWYFFCKFKFWF